MTTAEGPDFYDAALHPEWLNRGGYRDLFARTARLVPRGRRVVEIGCGMGSVGALIARRSASYVGFDFSPAAIAYARAHVPGVRFEVADLRDGVPAAEVYVANEVLEHVDDDLGLLAGLARGAIIVFSVPSFDSAGHVRYFPRRGDAVDRYAPVIAIDRTYYVPHGTAGRFFHLIRARL